MSEPVDRATLSTGRRGIVPMLSVDPRRAAVAYFGASLASLLLSLPLILAMGIVGMFICVALGPIGLLFHIGLLLRVERLSVSGGLNVLIVYLTATAILAGCFFLARNRRLGLRVGAYLLAVLVWLACAYLSFMGLVYLA